MAEDGACALLQRYAKPSLVCSSHEVERLRRLADVVKAFLRQRLQQFLLAHRDDPVLLFYSADGTPVSSRQAWQRTWGLLTARRVGGASQELLVQRLFACNLQGEVRVLLEEPQAMADKTAWTHLQALRCFHDVGRLAGHRGILVEHYVWDRAVQGSLSVKVQQLHEAARQHMASSPGAEGQHLLHLTSWVTSAGCCAHDAHNALKWSVLEWSRDPVLLRSAFIVLESLRRGYSLLAKHVDAWVRETLDYEEWAGFPAQRLWALLGLLPDIADVATELEIRFAGGRMKVSPKWRGRGDTVDAVVLVLLHCWAFRSWSESRWLSLGPSCRTLLAALVLGLREFVPWALSRPGASRYFLGGFCDHLKEQVGQLCATIALSSFVADAALASMLCDDRLVQTVASLEEELVDEIRYVSAIPACIWDFCAEAVGWRGRALRHQAVSAALTSAGFLRWRLAPLHQLPWSLASGDPVVALRDLCAGPCPTEAVARKIWSLGRMGFASSALHEGLRLLGNCSFSSLGVEQGHAHASRFAKQHRGYSVETICTRAFISSVAPLLSHGEGGRQVQVAQARLEKLRRRRVGNIGAQQCFVGELVRLSRTLHSSGRVRGPVRGVQQRAFAIAGRLWRGLPARQKERFLARSRAARAEAEERLEQDLSAARAQLQLARARQAEEASAQGLRPLRLSSASWSQHEKGLLEELWRTRSGSGGPGRGGGSAGRAAVVGPPPPSLQQVLLSMQVGEQVLAAVSPPWLDGVCRHRDFFSQAVLKLVDSEGGEQFVKVAFARQAPQRVLALVALRPCAPGEAAARPPRAGGHFERELWSWRLTLEVQPGDFAFSDAQPLDPQWAAWAAGGACFYEDLYVGVDAEFSRLEDIIMELDGPAGAGERQQEAGAEEAASGSTEAPVWASLPWLLEHFAPGELEEAPAGSGAGGSRARAPAPDPVELTAMDAEQALEELYERRLLWAEEGAGDAQPEHFRWFLRGGQWTARHRGVAFDSWRAAPSGKAAEAWCTSRRCPRSATFACTLYTEAGGQALAVLWAHRLNWMYGVDMQEGVPVQFTQEVLRRYREPPGAAAAAEAAGPAARERLAEIRAVVPA